MGDRGLHRADRVPYVEIERAEPFVGTRGEGVAADRAADVRDHMVNRPERFDRRGDELLERRVVGDVRRARVDPHPERPEFGRRLLDAPRVARAQGEVAALRGQRSAIALPMPRVPPVITARSPVNPRFMRVLACGGEPVHRPHRLFPTFAMPPDDPAGATHRAASPDGVEGSSRARRGAPRARSRRAGIPSLKPPTASLIVKIIS